MRHAIEKEMQIFNEMLRESVQSDKEQLGMVTKFLLNPAGKQMRPILTLLTAALHGEINNKSYASAILFEILHWGTLVHDDVIDEAYMRRGDLTLGALIRSRRAILVGDYLLSRGFVVTARAENFNAIVSAAYTTEKLIEGELLQSEHASKLNTTREDYFKIINYKTATLLAAVAESGADSVGATKDQCQKMRLMGEYIGMAFQIQDDLLDILPSESGKDKYNDFQERKMTLPLIYAIEQSGKRKEAIRHLCRAAEKQSSIKWLMDLISEYKGVEHARETMEQYHAKAIDILMEYPDSEVRKSLIAYCDFVIGRNK